MESIILLGLGLNAWLTIILVFTMFGLMMFTKLPAEFVFLGGMGFLFVTGILTTDEALGGFSSSSVVTIGVLFVVIAGLVNSGVIHWMVKNLLGTPSSYNKTIIRLMVPVAVLSSVLSNTTVVALFINVVKIWSKKLNIAPSKLLIPLSYASCFGGICTLIGTPPNLIISGMLQNDNPAMHMNIFITTLPGLFCLAVGILSMLAMQKLLPVRKSPDMALNATDEYTVELLVPSDCKIIGQTISEAGLNNVSGGRLFEIVRFDNAIITPVADDEFLMGGDRLIFSGEIEALLELRDTYGLTSAPHHVFSLNEQDSKRQLFTATVKRGGCLIGNSMDMIDFEEHNNVALVAIVREGERINVNPRSEKLQYGDTLLLECPASQANIFREAVSKDLHLLDSPAVPTIGKSTIISSVIMISMVLLSTFNVLSLLQSCFLAAFAMLVTKCCTTTQAWKSINWEILMIFAGSICLGTAIAKTGVATSMSNAILGICGANAMVALICICFVATFLTEFISNTACAAMFYPIAYKTAVLLGANPITFCIALMIAVSSSFATPIGSPTHMLVYGEGGYRFTDFMKVGLFMNIIILAANIFIVSILFPL